MSPASVWDGDQPAIYTQTFAHMCAGAIPQILSWARPSVLMDVGYGTGGLLGAAAHQGFHAMGCDANAHMCELARATCADSPHPVPIWQAALPGLAGVEADVVGHIDTVTAAFVIQHVGGLAEQRAAFCGLARLARRGGRVITSVWAPGFLAHRTPVLEVIDHLDPPRHQGEATPSSTAIPAPELSELACSAGLTVLAEQEITWVWRISWENYWRAVSAGIAHLGQRYLATASELREHITAECQAALAPYGAPGVMELPCRATLCVADKP